MGWNAGDFGILQRPAVVLGILPGRPSGSPLAVFFTFRKVFSPSNQLKKLTKNTSTFCTNDAILSGMERAPF